ncbi:MAG: sensor domain-containing protein [Patescibacteria group bacterium]|nr:sensor domain-containing protein [Patescibacteria group bacterium]MDD5715791.1 sensor domain-containing protein [Patescibacteria group bacterium]
MTNHIEDYLIQLKENLSGCDPAMIQDALSDAEEYLRSELEYSRKNNPTADSDKLLAEIIDKYGTPTEIAASYKDAEARLSPTVVLHPRPENKGALSGFFYIFSDPRAWSGLLYGIFSLITGIIYFTWAVTGVSLSLGLIILIIGLPVTGLFLLSVKGISFVEGRIVEGLLGIRMPRKSQSNDMHLSMWGRFKSLFTDSKIWLSVLYMILMLPLGVIYFSVYVTLFTVSLSIIVSPLVRIFYDAAIIETAHASYTIPPYLFPLTLVIGVIMLATTLHLAKKIGGWHGLLAKSMLVRQ